MEKAESGKIVFYDTLGFAGFLSVLFTIKMLISKDFNFFLQLFWLFLFFNYFIFWFSMIFISGYHQQINKSSFGRLVWVLVVFLNLFCYVFYIFYYRPYLNKKTKRVFEK